MWDVSAKKFALQAQYGRKMLFLGVLVELFRGGIAERGVLVELFRGTAADGPHGACERWPQSLWAPLVSEEKLRMQFPSRHFKS